MHEIKERMGNRRHKLKISDIAEIICEEEEVYEDRDPTYELW
jgi:hypothetical protein